MDKEGGGEGRREARDWEDGGDVCTWCFLPVLGIQGPINQRSPVLQAWSRIETKLALGTFASPNANIYQHVAIFCVR